MQNFLCQAIGKSLLTFSRAGDPEVPPGLRRVCVGLALLFLAAMAVCTGITSPENIQIADITADINDEEGGSR